MKTSGLVKLNKKGQIVVPRDICEKMGFACEANIVIFTRDDERHLVLIKRRN